MNDPHLKRGTAGCGVVRVVVLCRQLENYRGREELNPLRIEPGECCPLLYRVKTCTQMHVAGVLSVVEVARKLAGEAQSDSTVKEAVRVASSIEEKTNMARVRKRKGVAFDHLRIWSRQCETRHTGYV